MGDTNLLTSISIDGEYTPNTLSERRGWVLRASVENLMVRYPSSTQGQIKALFAGNMLDNVLKAYPLFEHE